MTDPVQTEQAVTRLIAEILGRTPDTDLFRGSIPPDTPEGIAVRIDPAGAGRLRPPEFGIQVLGKFGDRDAALMLNSRLARAFPKVGFLYDGIHFKHLAPRGDPAVWTAPDRGKLRTFTSFNLVAVTDPADTHP